MALGNWLHAARPVCPGIRRRWPPSQSPCRTGSYLAGVDEVVAAEEDAIGVRHRARLVTTGWTGGCFLERQRFLRERVAFASFGPSSRLRWQPRLASTRVRRFGALSEAERQLSRCRRGGWQRLDTLASCPGPAPTRPGGCGKGSAARAGAHGALGAGSPSPVPPAVRPAVATPAGARRASCWVRPGRLGGPAAGGCRPARRSARHQGPCRLGGGGRRLPAAPPPHRRGCGEHRQGHRPSLPPRPAAPNQALPRRGPTRPAAVVRLRRDRRYRARPWRPRPSGTARSTRRARRLAGNTSRPGSRAGQRRRRTTARRRRSARSVDPLWSLWAWFSGSAGRLPSSGIVGVPRCSHVLCPSTGTHSAAAA